MSICRSVFWLRRKKIRIYAQNIISNRIQISKHISFFTYVFENVLSSLSLFYYPYLLDAQTGAYSGGGGWINEGKGKKLPPLRPIEMPQIWKIRHIHANFTLFILFPSSVSHPPPSSSLFPLCFHLFTLLLRRFFLIVGRVFAQISLRGGSAPFPPTWMCLCAQTK